MVFPLPNNITISSISGDWSYDSTKNALIWQGELQENQTIPLKASLVIPAAIPTDSPLLLTFQFYDEKGSLINYQVAIPINQSAFVFHQEWYPHSAQPGDIITLTLRITNTGSIADSLNLTETLKDGLKLIPVSLHDQNGTFDFLPQGFHWQTTLSPDEAVTLHYQARVTQTKPGGFLFARSDWQSSFDKWLAYARIDLPWIYYFPFIGAR
jgi:uncharacterized repeat protein (TIGR01451 family)